MSTELPQPDAAALTHSQQLAAHIHEVIAVAGGWLPFSAYMDLALYAPGLGYYSAGARKLGPAGDFVTAPEISPLFSQCVAGQCAEVLTGLDDGVILELGAGSGVMAADVLLELAELGQLPSAYLILEPSADLRERQAQTLAAKAPDLRDRVQWLDAAPEGGINGVIVANEVADALAVERFVVTAAGVQEQGVISADAELVLDNRPARPEVRNAVEALQAELGSQFPAGYTSEVCLRLPAWVAALGEWLNAGAALLIDYGFSRPEYYLPERSSGTLRCFYRHRAHDDALLWPGLQDITAWVDFSALADAAGEAGLQVAGYTTQAQFLLAAGLEQKLAANAATDGRAQAELARGLRQLILPGEMGDAVKVMALTRGEQAVPSAMLGRDMRSAL